jgi:c-di-GMP-binding flagellar brake protein YcgR
MSKKSDKVREGMRMLIEVEWPDVDDASTKVHGASLASAVYAIVNDREFIIQMPMYKNYKFVLPRNRDIKTFLFSESRMFTMEIRYVDTIRLKGTEFLKVAKVGDITASQRRECYRLETGMIINVMRFNQNPDQELLIETKSNVINISCSGVLFASDEDFDIGEEVVFNFKVYDDETLGGEILRTAPTYGVGIYKFRVTAKFHHKDPDQKERINRYVFEQQMDRLRLTRD